MSPHHTPCLAMPRRKWIAQWLVLAFFLYGGAEAMNTIDMWIGGEQFLPKTIYIKIATASMSSAIIL